jgi:thymidylate kinase
MSLLVNFETIDSSGKKEQSARLVAALRERGLRVGHLVFPDRPDNGGEPSGLTQRSTGRLITAYLFGQLKLIEERDSLFRNPPLCDLSKDDKVDIASVIEEKIFQVLQSVNRREVVFREGGLLDLLDSCDVVVVERLLSARAYGVAYGVSRVEIDALEEDLPKPDLSVLLDVDPALARSSGLRSGYSEKWPEIRRLYDLMVREDLKEGVAEQRLSHWLEVDASQPEEQIRDQILDAVLRLLPPTLK